MPGFERKGRRMGRWNPELEPQEGDFKPISPLLWERLERIAREDMQSRRLPRYQLGLHELPYHNWAHVKQFMRDADFLAVRERLTPLQRENIRIAAMFHDMGNLIMRQGHEELGRQMLHEILAGTELEPRRA